MLEVCQSDSNQNIFLQKFVFNKQLCRSLQRYRFNPIGPVVVLGDQEDVKDTNAAGIIAYIIDSFSSINPEEEPKEELLDNLPQYGRDSTDFNQNHTGSDKFEYQHQIKGVPQENVDEDLEENDRSSLRNTRVTNYNQSKDLPSKTILKECLLFHYCVLSYLF
jgi:hypothetical protein